MQLLDLNEPAIAAVLARLEANFPAYVDAVNATVTDGYEIEPIAQLFPQIPSVGLLTQWPSVGIQDLSADLTDDTGFSATGVSDLAVVAFLNDADLVALGWKLRRYARALASCLLEGRSLDNGIWSVVFQGVRPGPTLGDAEDPAKVKTYTSWIAVLLQTKHEEG